ncbi:hypothetical protein [Leisingera sp. S232]
MKILPRSWAWRHAGAWRGTACGLIQRRTAGAAPGPTGVVHL